MATDAWNLRVVILYRDARFSIFRDDVLERMTKVESQFVEFVS